MRIDYVEIDEILGYASIDSMCHDDSWRGWVDDDGSEEQEVIEFWNSMPSGSLRDLMTRTLETKRRFNSEYQELLESVEDNGVLRPIGVCDFTVHNGHHLLAVLEDLGYTHVPVYDEERNEDGPSAWGACEGFMREHDMPLLPPPADYEPGERPTLYL